MKKTQNEESLKIVTNKKKFQKFKTNFINSKILILFLCFLILIFICYFTTKEKKIFYFDKYEPNVFNEIKDKLIKSKCSIMWDNQREFVNGIIRKYKPKKILELGVALGGSSIIIVFFLVFKPNLIRLIKFYLCLKIFNNKINIVIF